MHNAFSQRCMHGADMELHTVMDGKTKLGYDKTSFDSVLQMATSIRPRSTIDQQVSM